VDASRTPYAKKNLRYSQVAPLTMFEEKNTGRQSARADRNLCRGRGRVQIPVRRQGRPDSANKTFFYQADAVDSHTRSSAAVPEGENTDARHGRLPTLSLGDRHRRHERRTDDEDGEARLDALSRFAADDRRPLRAAPFAISRWRRKCTR